MASTFEILMKKMKALSNKANKAKSSKGNVHKAGTFQRKLPNQNKR